MTQPPIDRVRFPAPQPARRLRTPAQAQASRRNGAKSRGPKTAAGKAVARQNGLRHGIFAKALRPAPGASYAHRDYDLLLEQLRLEHRPTTQTQAVLVEALAADLLALRRLLQLRERSLNPPPSPSVVFEDAGTVEDHERELAEMERLVEACRNGRRFDLPQARVVPLCEYTHEVLQTLRENTASVEAELAAGGQPEEPWLEQATAYRAIDPGTLKILEPEVLAQVLADRRTLSEDERRRLAILLGQVRNFKRVLLESRREEQADYEHQQRYEHEYLLGRLPSLEVILRFEVHARRAVQRTLAMLREL